MDQKLYYDQGWNDRIKGVAYDIHATEDWQDGWKDCNDAPLEDRKEIE